MSGYDGVLLASGGMDSTVLAYDLKNQGKNIILLFLDYGQHCMEKEYETLKRVAPACYEKNIKTIKIGDVYKESNSRMIIEANLWVDNVVAEDLYLPYRNYFFFQLHQPTLSLLELRMFILHLSIAIMQKRLIAQWSFLQSLMLY